VTVLASAAAVVAAGTFGGHVSTLAADGSLRTPVANAAGALSGTEPRSARTASSLPGAELFSLGSLTTASAAKRGPDAGPRPSSRPASSVNVASVLRAAGRPDSSTAGPASFWSSTRSAAAKAAPAAKPADSAGSKPPRSTTAATAPVHGASAATP
jgi:hypothetical protein